MLDKSGPKRRKPRLKTIAVSALCAAFLTCPAVAPAAPRDFGTETVDPATEKDPALQVLPVDLVEDSIGEVRPAVAPQQAPSAPATAEGAQPTEEKLPGPFGVAPGSEAAKLPSEEFDLSKDNDYAPDAGQMSNEATTLLNAKEVDIAALIKSFSKLTNRNYILDSAVKGKVSILLPSPVTVPEALRILDSVLLLKGFTTVPVEKNTWKVIPAKDARQTTIPIVADTPERPSDALVTQIIRLKNVQAQELQQALSQFVSKDGLVNAFGGTNSIIIIDSAANIERLSSLARQLDVPALDQDITIIPVLHAEAKDLAEKLNQLLGENEQQKSQALASISPAARNVAGITPTPGGDRGGSRRALPVKVIPDERTNSLVVVADPTTTLKIRAIVEQLDSPMDKSGGRFYVYKLKYADAEELADVLSSLITGSPSTGSGRRETRGGSSISRSERDRDRGGSEYGGGRGGSRFSTSSRSSSRGSRSMLEREDRAAGTGRTGGGAITGGAQGGEGGGKVNFEGEVSIAPDASTNSLIINASYSDFLKIKQVVEELDVKRRQVVVEATILEVSVDENEGMGIELQGTAANEDGGIIGQTNFGGITNILANPAALTDLTIAAASTGTLTLPGGLVIPSQAVLVNAVSRNRNVNVLSTPTITTTDNQEAEIIVGENVPFISSQSTDTSNLGNTFTQIERQDVGITLRITPQISGGNFVTLQIFVEISNVVEGTRNDPNGPTTTIRTTDTAVEVKNGQMVVTGGLIGDSVEDSSRGVPYFEDIPVLGNLFRRDDQNRRRTNLLMFITPRILADQFDARDATVERRDRLSRIIDDYKAEPPRTETLFDDSIDRVAESLPPRKVDSTSITPPNAKVPIQMEERQAVQRTQERVQHLLKLDPGKPQSAGDSAAPASSGAEASGAKSDPVEVTVRPKLPAIPSSTFGTQSRPSMSRPATEQDAVPNTPGPQELSGPKQYVVLTEVGAGNSGETLGLVVPAEGTGSDFFAVGRRYKYNSPEGPKKYVCLGAYGSQVEAAKTHKALSHKDSWKEFSLKEFLELGKTSWQRG